MVSLVIVVVVTMYISSKTKIMSDEFETQLTTLMDEVNAITRSQLQMRKTQAASMSQVDSNFDVITSETSTFPDLYVAKSQQAKEVISQNGTFDNITLNQDIGMSVLAPTADDAYFRVGFNGSKMRKGMVVGDELMMMFNNGNTSISTLGGGSLNIYNGGNPNSGFVLSNNAVGVGAIPNNVGTLQVDGAVWTKDGLMTSTSNTHIPVMTFDSSNALRLNPIGGFESVQIGGQKVSIGGVSRNNAWSYDVATSNNMMITPVIGTGKYVFDDKGTLTIQGESSGLNVRGGYPILRTELPNVNGSNILSGDTLVHGNLSSSADFHIGGSMYFNGDHSQSIDKYGISQSSDKLRMFTPHISSASLSFSTLQDNGSFIDNVTISSDGSASFFSPVMFHDNVMAPNIATATIYVGSSSNNNMWNITTSQQGDMSIAAESDILHPSMNITRDGMVSARKLSGTQICSDDECLSSSDISQLRNMTSNPAFQVSNGLASTSMNVRAAGNITSTTGMCVNDQCLTANDIMRLKDLLTKESSTSVAAVAPSPSTYNPSPTTSKLVSASNTGLIYNLMNTIIPNVYG